MKEMGKMARKEASWNFQSLGYHIAPPSYPLFSLPPKHSCFHFACQRIKHMEFAAHYHTDTFLQAQRVQ